MIGIPVLMAVVLGALTWMLGGQWRARRRPHQLAWAVALGAGCAGTVAFILSNLTGGDPLLFRLYYLGGAVLIAPLLGVGSAYLLGKPLWARLMLAVAVVSGVCALVGLVGAPLSRGALAALGIAPGTTLITAPLVVVAVIVGNSLGTVAVVGVAVASLLRAWRGGAPARFAWGNGLIAAGTLVIAAAGTMARLGHGAGFWATMTVGWCVVYTGVTTVSAVRLPAAQTAPAVPAHAR